jgi:hypothetical protein
LALPVSRTECERRHDDGETDQCSRVDLGQWTISPDDWDRAARVQD